MTSTGELFDPALTDRLPRPAMVTWVERELPADENLPAVDWRVLAADDLVGAFRSDVPDWARWAADVPGCDGARP